MSTQSITLESTIKVMSGHSGLILFDELWNRLNLKNRIRRLLPKKKKNRGTKQTDKFKSILFSFASGNDCLSDLDDLLKDSLFRSLAGGGLHSRTAGDFLFGFHKRQIEKLQEVLLETTFFLRMAMYEENKSILSMDSTPHKQCGNKMEKLGFNYKGIWGFDSQNAYDQFGFSYLFDLRPGNTHSGIEAERWIHQIFSRCPEWMERYFRADSAYGKYEVYAALEAAKVKYTIVLKENIGRYVRRENKGHLDWVKTEIIFFDSADCEIAMGLYHLENLGTRRVVFIRAKKSEDEIKNQLDLFKEYDPEEDNYKHYSIITNIDSSDLSGEEIIEFYRGRANCENFIKEQKYGFDFLHFPCKKFEANQVWGLIGTFAHNMTRFLSFCMPQKIKRVRGKDDVVRTVTQLGYFAKKVRSTVINLPSQVVRRSRSIKLKLNSNHKEVLEILMTNIQRMFKKETLFNRVPEGI
jgi:hypothetical protein